MQISNGYGRSLAAAVAIALTAGQALAKSADTLQDLVGATTAQAEGTLSQRGWSLAASGSAGGESHGYWWNASRKDCVKLTAREGRYAAVEDAKAGDCNQKSSGSGTGTAVAVAAVGAAAVAAILLSRKSKDRNDGGYQPEWQQVEAYNLDSGSLRIFSQPSKNARVVRSVGSGTVLRNFGCDDYNSESWCEVATMDGRTNGWARDRYLRVTDNAGYPGNNGGGWSGGNNWGGDYRGTVEVYGLQSGSLKIMASPSKDGRVVGKVGSGTTLRSGGCQTSSGENWCEVSTMNGRTRGWARERYLRRQ